jgi:pimeloyl-ACP methyl ester carboxylesterase
VIASDVVGVLSSPLRLRLREQGFDARYHPFDWRLDIRTLGTRLAAAIKASPVPVDLVAHSMGGLVAIEAAASPAVARVIALGAAATMPVHEDLLRMAREDSAGAQALIAKWGCDPAHPQAENIRQLVRGLMQKVPADCLYYDLAACNAYAGAAGCAKPLGVIAGTHDKMARAVAGRALADSCAKAQGEAPGANYAEINCGHFMIFENPLGTAQAISALAA